MNVTTKVSVDGWRNLRELLNTAVPTYNGTQARFLTIINNNAGVVYVHFTNDGTNAPATAADGIPLANAAVPAAQETFEDVDLTSTWINAAAATDVVFAVRGL